MRVEKRKRLIPLMAVGFLLLSVMASSAKTIRYVYDDLNRLEYVYYGDGMVLQYDYDEVGNRDKQIVTITDTTAPSTTTSTPEGLYNSDQTVEITCEDGEGVGCDKIYYTVDGSNPTTASNVYSNPISMSSTTTLKYFVVDLAGNKGAIHTQVYTIDTVPPVGTIAIDGGALYTNNLSPTLTLSCSDSSGCTQMQFSNDNTNWSTPDNYAATKVWTLLSGDGSKTVYVKFKDGAGNWSNPPVNRQIIVDTILPTGSISINNGLTFTNNPTVTLTLTCNDNNIYCAFVKVSNNSIFWELLSSGTMFMRTEATATWTLEPGDGLKTVYAQFSDFARNWSILLIDTIELDTAQPTGTLTINGGASYTNSPNVTLTLSCNDSSSGCSQMQFSNDNTNWSTPETYATTKEWTLATGDGTKSVYVKFRDVASNWSSPFADTIILDTTPPLTSASPMGGYFNAAQTVTLSCSDGTGSGCDKIYYTIDGSTATTSSSIFSDPIMVESTTTLSYFASDLAGHSEATKFQTYIIDTIPPTGSVTINAGADFANNSSVTLSLTCNDNVACGLVKYSNDNVNWSFPSLMFKQTEATETWTLTPGDGPKTVYVMFMDLVQNWSASYSDTIVLDTDLPTGTIAINAGQTYINNTSGNLTLSCVDSSDCTQMQFSNDSIDWSTPENYTSAKAWILPTGDGSKAVYVRYKDGADNWSNIRYDTIVLDTVPPTGSVTINGGAPFTNNEHPSLTLYCTDSSLCTQMLFSQYNMYGTTPWSTPQPWPPSGIGLILYEGTNILYVKYKDAANNWSQVYSASIVLDTIPPYGSILINGGALYTNNESVDLSLYCGDNSYYCTGMMFSNDNISWSAPQSYAPTKAWTLPSGDGTKSVYVKYRDIAGNLSYPYYARILLDKTAPSTTASPAGNFYDTVPVVTFSCDDGAGSGCDKIYFTTDGQDPTALSGTYSWPVDLYETTNLKYLATDLAGNSEKIKNEIYTLDSVMCTLPPVRIVEASQGNYNTLQEAYEAASDGDTIQSQAVYFMEDLLLNRNISVTLEGGYNCYFTTRASKTILMGGIDVLDGALTIENFLLE